MPTKRNWLLSTVAAALLPASVSQIDPRSSQTWLHEVQRYFEAVESSLSNETLK